MRENDLRELMPQFMAYHGRFQGFFCGSEGRGDLTLLCQGGLGKFKMPWYLETEKSTFFLSPNIFGVRSEKNNKMVLVLKRILMLNTSRN